MGNTHIYEATYGWRLHGQECAYVMHFLGISATATATQLTSVMASGGTLGGRMKLVHSIDATFISCRAQRLYPDRSESHNRAFGPNPNGLSPSSSHPSFVAMYLTWRTVLRGRRRTGKQYLGGVPVSAVQNGLLTQNGQSLYSDFIAGVLAAWGPGGTSTNWRIGCWSRVLSPDPDSPNPDAFRGFISGEFTMPISSQRKRRVGVGN